MMMTSNHNKQVIVVWLALVALTLIMWGMGLEHDRSRGASADIIMAVVLAIAFAKTLAIGSIFMELRTAPLPLRLVFGAWAIGVGAIVITLYLWL